MEIPVFLSDVFRTNKKSNLRILTKIYENNNNPPRSNTLFVKCFCLKK